MDALCRHQVKSAALAGRGASAGECESTPAGCLLGAIIGVPIASGLVIDWTAMARMFPEQFPQHAADDPARRAEVRVFEALAGSLSDRFRVFYSVAWLDRGQSGSYEDGEADFVIVHPDLGLVVIEVKGGGIERDGHSGQWSSRDREGELHAIKDPIAQARRSQHALLRKLRDLRSLSGRWIEATHGAVFPDCVRDGVEIGFDAPTETIAFADDLPDLGAWVEALLRHGASSRAAELGADGCLELERLLAPSFELRTPLAVSLREDDEQLIRLTEQQFAALDLLSRKRRAVITGGPGTGKSILAAEKARRLASEGFRTLLVCFNRPLADRHASTIGQDEQLTAATFHDLCFQFARGVGLIETDWVANPAPDFFSTQLPRMFLEALGRKPELAFDAIVIDEAQDFESDQLEHLQLALADEVEGIFYVFVDMEQAVYGQQDWSFSEVDEFPLTRNLRNTRSIHECGLRFRSAGELVSDAPHGRPVELIEAADPSSPLRSLTKLLHRLINEEHIRPEEIAILTGRGHESSAFAGVERFGVFSCAPPPGTAGKVIFESVRRFKGLDSPVVILIEMESVIDDAALMHVAITRARSHLAVIGSEAVVRAIAHGPGAVEDSNG